jgi:hypothetical protein
MPKLVSEIAAGTSYEFNAEQRPFASSVNRVFKVIKESAAEYINIFQACGVTIGAQHPTEPQHFCVNASAQYEGESRFVILVTFNYRFFPLPANRIAMVAPDIRPANWSISTSLFEVPAWTWKPITGPAAGIWKSAKNPVGDMYEGVTRVEPLVTISVVQFESIDPTRHALLAGSVNTNPLTLGSLVMPPRTVMFRGVNTLATVETFGQNQQYRGWNATYEFAYRKNYVGFPFNDNLGWDIVQPQTGLNCRAFALPGNAEDDVYGQPLRWNDVDRTLVRPLALPLNVSAGDKMRATVRIASKGSDGDSQTTSGAPVPLNDNGRPRAESAIPKVILHRYQVQPDIDFTSAFGLRLI